MNFEENRPHKKLILWKNSMEFVSNVYKLTNKFPKSEVYGLKSQIRRSAISIPSNIAEGLSRKAKKEKLHFLNISQGSISELDTQMEIAFMLDYLNNEDYISLMNSLITIQKLLSGIVNKLNSQDDDH